MASIIQRCDIELVNRLAEGAFGTVFAALWEGQPVAAKRLSQEEGQQEGDFLSKLDHHNIVQLLGVVDDHLDVFLILEFCDGGSLRRYLDVNRGKYLGLRFYDWAKQAARAIEYLKEKHIVHKDVKSPNYLIKNTTILKLADFGLAKNVGLTVTRVTETASYPWMAPELLRDNVLSPAYDIHSFGIVAWELWTTDAPFGDAMEPANLIWRICHNHERPPIPAGCPEAIADLLKACWQSDWKRRPTIQHILVVLISEQKKATEAESAQTTLPSQNEPPAKVSDQKDAREDNTVKDAVKVHEEEITLQLAKLDIEETEAKKRQFIAGPWELKKEFGYQDGKGKLSGAWGIATSPDGNISVASYQGAEVCVYGDDGAYRFSLDTTKGTDPKRQSYPRNITVNNEGVFYVTDDTQYVKTYSQQGEYTDRWPVLSPDGKPSNTVKSGVCGLAMTNNGQLLVGQVRNPVRYISRHEPDSSHVEIFEVEVSPYQLAATSQDTIIISGAHGSEVQILDNGGQVLHTLNTNTQVPFWNPYGVCFYNDIILVCNTDLKYSHEILCFSTSAEYMGSIPVKKRPWGVTITKNDCNLLVSHDDRVHVLANKMLKF